MRIIFDGNNTALRCDYVSDLYNSQGKRTSAILGVLDTISCTTDTLQDLTGQDVTDIIFVWDLGKSERRKALWPEYKAHRHKDLVDPIADAEAKLKRQEQLEQMDYLHMVLPSFGIKSIRLKGEEADDLAYDLKCELRKLDPNDEIIYVTSDGDYLQLVDKYCSVWSPMKKTLITLKNFKEVIGVKIESFIDYKVLIGDKSDNIPGIDGIGKLKSAMYMNTYVSVDNLIKTVATDKKLQSSKILSKFLHSDTHETVSIGQQLIDFKYVDYSNIQDRLQEFIASEVHLDKKEVKRVLMTNQFTSILAKMNDFMRIFNDLEYNKHGEL